MICPGSVLLRLWSGILLLLVWFLAPIKIPLSPKATSAFVFSFFSQGPLKSLASDSSGAAEA